MGDAGGNTGDAAGLLFEYLGNVLYHPEDARLDLDSLPEDFRELGQGLMYYAQCVNELRTFAQALSKGNLSAPLPPSSNELAAPLKSLHASLKHLTWQSQQVAQGDYSQRVDFMGEFSEAFNSMIELLDERQKALVAEIDSGREKTLALEQSNNLFESITDTSSQCIVVQDKQTGEHLFANRAAAAMLGGNDEFTAAVNEWMASQTALMAHAENERTDEVSIECGGTLRIMQVLSHPLRWRSRGAVAYVISDVSEERMMVQQLETAAYQDNLTQLYSRHYGMQALRDWLAEGRAFSLCFVDLDNLKYVNDTYGHTEGDHYITDVADLLRSFSEDSVASRLGGDEFMVLAEGWDEHQAQDRMEELRGQLAPIPGENARYDRSISYGVVEVAENDPRVSSDLLSEADERMYRYKRAHKAQRRLAL